MLSLVFFVTGCYATAVSDVACNGKDTISFLFTKTAGTTVSKFSLTGCSNQVVDLATTTYSVSGDDYAFNFNPYTVCGITTDPNDPTTYSLDVTLLAMRNEEIGGQFVIKGGDKAGLKCSFDGNYRVESDLGALKLSGEEIT